MSLTITSDTLPSELVEAIEDNLGKAEAKEWLIYASASANQHAEEWNISLDTVLTGGALSLCIAGQDDTGTRVVMKVPADIATGRQEIAALSVWGGHGCPTVIRVDEMTSVFLMEYLPFLPGSINAVDVFELAQELQGHASTPEFPFPDLSENVEMRIGWAEERFADLEYVFLRPDLLLAVGIYRRLLETGTGRSLLHGDFQRKNLLPTSAGLRTLDPHPCVGEPIFDSAFWLGVGYHDQPIETILSQYPAPIDSMEYMRFLCWVWVISVIENRPYQRQGADERQDFISRFRAAAMEAAELL